jgi:purine-nucleoside phosphorylase
MTIWEKMQQAVRYIRTRADVSPEIGIVLGTGLGGLAKEIQHAVDIPYHEIPGFVTSTMEFHEGRLILGELGGKPVVAMQGRFHFYEGYSMQEITFPVRVMHALGAKMLVISNAAGGMNPSFRKGCLVLITDHINLLSGNPLIGVNEPEFGTRFPDMSRPYSERLIVLAREAALKRNIDVREGVYVAVAGPSLETRAEYRFLRMIGADMVGMSTVPETIVAVQMGMEVLGVTIVSDLCLPDSLEPVSIEEIVATCNGAEPGLTAMVSDVIRAC